MYNETYDEYIRSILGYPINNSYNNEYQTYNNQNAMNLELEKSYPETYKILYPMIKSKCDNFRGSLTNEEIENMTDEIYYAFDSSEAIQLNINLKNEVRANASSNVSKTGEKRTDVKVAENLVENRETRQINSDLRDLVKILLIRELLNKPARPGPGPRPPIRPMPGPGPRPPFGPRPGGIMFNRDFEINNYDIFEY